MKYLIGVFKQFWHCVFNLHQPMNFYDCKTGKCIGVGCWQCGKGFWEDKSHPLWRDDHAKT